MTRKESANHMAHIDPEASTAVDELADLLREIIQKLLSKYTDSVEQNELERIRKDYGRRFG